MKLSEAVKIAKKVKTKKLFIKEYYPVYRKSLKMGWMPFLDKYLEDHQHQIKEISFEECQKFAQKANNRTDFNIKYASHFNVSKRNNWLDTFFPKEFKSDYKSFKINPIKRKAGHWHFDHVKRIVQQKGFKHVKEVYKYHLGLYTAILSKNWAKPLNLDTSISKNSKITLQDCLKEAKKYKTISSFQNGSRTLYWAAKYNGWIDQVCSHMVIDKSRQKIALCPRKTNWTDSELIKIAKKYKYRSDFQLKDRNAYFACYRRGKDFFEKAIDHMSRCKKRSKKITDQFLLNSIKKYKTIESFKEKNKSLYNLARKRSLIKNFSNPIQREVKIIAPEMFKKLSSLNLDKIEREKHFNGIRPDFVIEKNNKILIIEVKDDQAQWSSKELKNQVILYNKVFRKEYKSKFLGTILCSPNGRYGVSFEESILKIKKILKTR